MSAPSKLRRLGGVFIVFALALFSNEAWAEDIAKCSIMEIRASSDGAGIDGALKELEGKLTKPPFSAWKSFKLEKQHQKSAALMKATLVKLHTGGTLTILYRERNDVKGKKPRLRLGLSLDDKAGKRKADMTIRVDSGEFTLMGRDADKDGSSVILAVRCMVE